MTQWLCRSSRNLTAKSYLCQFANARTKITGAVASFASIDQNRPIEQTHFFSTSAVKWICKILRISANLSSPFDAKSFQLQGASPTMTPRPGLYQWTLPQTFIIGSRYCARHVPPSNRSAPPPVVATWRRRHLTTRLPSCTSIINVGSLNWIIRLDTRRGVVCDGEDAPCTDESSALWRRRSVWTASE